jgi:ABC-type uncharacterized transport system YnjBCD permease subunit
LVFGPRKCRCHKWHTTLQELYTRKIPGLLPNEKTHYENGTMFCYDNPNIWHVEEKYGLLKTAFIFCWCLCAHVIHSVRAKECIFVILPVMLPLLPLIPCPFPRTEQKRRDFH